MNNIFLDIGYYSWKSLYSENNPFDFLDYLLRIDNKNIIFSVDSQYSLRKEFDANYKKNRIPNENKIKAKLLSLEILNRYPDNSIQIDGLEADDIIGMMIEDNDIIIGEDKDYLTIPKKIRIFRKDRTEWNISRIKTKIKLNQGLDFLIYQIMKGDSTDNIPRLIPSKDRKSIPKIFEQENKIEYLLNNFDNDLIRNNLSLLMLPTPLYYGIDPIEFLKEKYL